MTIATNMIDRDVEAFADHLAEQKGYSAQEVSAALIHGGVYQAAQADGLSVAIKAVGAVLAQLRRAFPAEWEAAKAGTD